MEKRHLRLLHFGKKKQRISPTQVVMEKTDIEHIENEQITIEKFQTSYEEATFLICYKEKENTWNIPFLVESIIDTLIVDFRGEHLPDDIRLAASRLLDKIIEALRFKHKDKFWSLSHFYIDDEQAYDERKQLIYPKEHQEEWLRIYHQSKIEAMDDLNYFFFKSEDIHDLSLLIVGEDGKTLCQYLENMKLIYYRKIAENQYEIEFVDELDDMQNLQRKIVFARELAQFGYNIWVDYVD